LYPEPGTYDITLIASNAYNCPDTAQQNITIYGPAQAEFQVPITEVCQGDTIALVNTSTGSDEFIWLVDGVQASGFPLVFTEPGDYRLSLIASNAGVCFDTTTVGTVIRVYDAPEAGFVAVIDESPSIIGDTRFVNTSTDANTYFWDFGDGSTSEEQNPAHEYDENGPMTVTLYAYNTNAGQFTCVSQVGQRISYEPIYTFYVPNAISPDQNYGNNEVGLFLPKGIGVAAYELNIYSPWGDKVATLNQVFEGSPADAWDGTFNGSPVPQGAYLWTASIVYQNGHTDFKKGTVTLIR
jgi:PKD repeat protein